MKPSLSALLAGAALCLTGGAALPDRWNSGDPDAPFRIGAWAVTCSRDGNLHGIQEEGCAARLTTQGLEISVARRFAAVSVYADIRGCTAAGAQELPAAALAKGVDGRAARLLTTVKSVAAQKRRACGKPANHDLTGLKVSDLARFLDQSDDLQDLRAP